jgi:hypothetical protein
VPFHVEISSPVDLARVLNVGRDELTADVLEPWVAGLRFDFGGSEWQPRDSRLTILQGPGVDAEDEAGWAGALRGAEDVTRELLEAAEANSSSRAAVTVEADSIEAAVEALREGRRLQQIPWTSAVERIDADDPEVAAVILVVKRPSLVPPQL